MIYTHVLIRGGRDVKSWLIRFETKPQGGFIRNPYKTKGICQKVQK